MDSVLAKTQLAIGEAIQANPLAWNSAMLIFWGGAVFLAYLIKRENSFTAYEALLAIVGLKKFKRTWYINVMHFLVIAVPLALMYYVMSNAHRT